MNRKQALNNIAVLVVGTLTGTELIVTGCRNLDRNGSSLESDKQATLLKEIADTIIPPTDSPGAKEAGVGLFMIGFVRDCYNENEQQIFFKGLDRINDLSKKSFQESFLSLDPEQRLQILNALDDEAERFAGHKKADEPSHYFTMLKELTVFGYFTSQAGATQALRFVAVPGKYMGCIPYKAGEKAWAL